jgi:hypothetical protein
MRTARVEALRTASGAQSVVLVDIRDGSLSPYEFDHLGDVVGSYLTTLGFDGVVGPKSVRTEMSDAELEEEFGDFVVLRRDEELAKTIYGSEAPEGA